ncbi:pyridoxal phosphate-dependent class II aminotransferase [Rhodobacter sp. KR11]|uniref:threonine-phosphate decarboxylase n=1 Tax=Rhodobacter sp. KR11 TaxID=2974588 RepID=UPI002223A693|nr:threonine-phosphate decarboxylase [Rhodobacter sp. KR11]MCW1919463.1 pyridoxal phosphate-dependent class II aminotransferase [Rhodobacter sp. KR11]
MRDHGGDIEAARARFGGGSWVDLSTGINRVPYPVAVSAEAYAALPRKDAVQALMTAARAAYRSAAPMGILAGAQGAIQMVPGLLPRGLARVVSPTYNEHAACLTAQGWTVEPVPTLDSLAGADLGVVVNPNNPDGRIWSRDQVLALRGKVGLLVVDESFADPVPEVSVAAEAGPGLMVLRSFGKFYGLAGLRLGFALGEDRLVAQMAEWAGPWPVSGPALEIGARALADTAWQTATTTRLAAEARRLDALAAAWGWALVGGGHLFRTYDTGDAQAAQDFLARHGIWSRIFPWSKGWLRLGLPGLAEWDRLPR